MLFGSAIVILFGMRHIELLRGNNFHSLIKDNEYLGPIHTGRGTPRAMRRKQMGPVDVNGGVHTAHKQHQRKSVPICARAWHPVSCVDWALL